MGIGSTWVDLLDIIALQPVQNDWGSTQWDLGPLGPTLLIVLTCRQLK